MPTAGDWCLDGDVIVFGDLRMTLQRIATSHWRPDERLRSWGQVPMHRDHDAVLVPCAPNESLWLGAWLEDGRADCASPARIALRDAACGRSAVAALPDSYQLGALHNERTPEHTPPEPLHLPALQDCRRLALALECGTTRAALDLVLLPPAAWSALAHRAPPAPLDGPPPLPPRLG